MRDAIANGVSSEFRDELDIELSKIGLTHKVHESDLKDYLSCCMVAFEEVMKDKKLRNEMKIIQGRI